MPSSDFIRPTHRCRARPVLMKNNLSKSVVALRQPFSPRMSPSKGELLVHALLFRGDRDPEIAPGGNLTSFLLWAVWLRVPWCRNKSSALITPPLIYIVCLRKGRSRSSHLSGPFLIDHGLTLWDFYSGEWCFGLKRAPVVSGDNPATYATFFFPGCFIAAYQKLILLRCYRDTVEVSASELDMTLRWIKQCGYLISKKTCEHWAMCFRFTGIRKEWSINGLWVIEFT